MHPSATIAANSTKERFASRTMPNVSVPVWFDHWGTYGDYGGTYANWGHVVVWVPGRGFLSSPHSGFGSIWYSTLSQVEGAFNAKYRFWSLDINTLRVAKPAPKPVTPPQEEKEDEDMAVGSSIDTDINGTKTYAVYDRDGFWTQWIGGNQTYLNNIRKMFGVTTLHCHVSESHFGAIKRAVEAKSSSTVKIDTPVIPVHPEEAG